MIDLMKFCSTDPERPYLHKPWTHGEWIYASNGHIVVRVPRLDDVDMGNAPLKTAKIAESWFTEAVAAAFIPLPVVDVPAHEDENCEHCGGDCREHRCPDCTCVCETCDGTGVQPDWDSVGLGKVNIAAKYYRMLRELPGIEIALDQSDLRLRDYSIPFRFAGGEGRLMPMVRVNKDHHYSAEVVA